MKLGKINSVKINSDTLSIAAFVLFLCNPFIKRIFAFVLSALRLNHLSTACACIVIYLPVFLLCFLSLKRVKIDSILLLVATSMFFLITYAMHPEYDFWYKREYYGVWDYVLRPDNGIYAYFFIRLINNPQKISKAVKISGLIMLMYYSFLLLTALKRGYWESTDHDGRAIQLSYDLTFGYDVSLYALFFLYTGIKKKAILDWVLACCYILMIILGGSRGPLMCLAIFALIMGVQMMSAWKKHPIITIICVSLFVLFIIFYEAIFAGIMMMLSKFGFSSRSMTMLLSGNIMDDNGRSKIWNAALEMIQERPFGYGAMGTRHVIYRIHDVGHPHQFFLELLVDFGVVFGSIFILFLLCCAIKMIFKPKAKEWNGIFIVFFCRSCQLLLSGTFWHVMPFWACVGIGVCSYKAAKNKRIYERRLLCK